MSKMRPVIVVMVLVAALIVAEAVYIFTRPQKLDLGEGMVLLGIAIGGLILLMLTLLVVWKSLSKTQKKEK
jgi:uncharacterized integral membrane protein